jgi:hypothetical protein
MNAAIHALETRRVFVAALTESPGIANSDSVGPESYEDESDHDEHLVEAAQAGARQRHRNG